MNLQKLPKVELHRHLECSIRFSTFIEICKTKKIEVPQDIATQKDRFLVTKPMKDLESVLNKFLLTQSILDSAEILTRIAYEAVEDAYHEGIQILELRYAPTFVRQNHEHLSFEDIHQAFLKGLKMAEKFPVATGLICIIQRILPLKDAEAVTQFAIENRDSFIALDLADNEVGFDSKPFAPFFQKAKAHGLHITVHSGEAAVPKSAWFVKDAIDILGAERIGHGVQIYQEPQMIDYVIQKKIPLELCVTSNYLTQAVATTQSHPLKELMQKGVLVTINSDDPGIFDANLLGEYELLAREHQFSESEFNRCNDIAAQYSFIEHSLKQKFWPRPILK